jgi:hypothetical protein
MKIAIQKIVIEELKWFKKAISPMAFKKINLKHPSKQIQIFISRQVKNIVNICLKT